MRAARWENTTVRAPVLALTVLPFAFAVVLFAASCSAPDDGCGAGAACTAPCREGRCLDDGGSLLPDSGELDAGTDAGSPDGGPSDAGTDAGTGQGCAAELVRCGATCVSPADLFTLTTVDAGYALNRIALVDLDADGGLLDQRPELVGFAQFALRAYRIDQSGSALASLGEQAHSSASSFAVADFDGDKRQDFALTTASSQVGIFWSGNEDGGLFRVSQYPSAGLTYGVVVEEVTGDNRSDVIVSNVFADRLTVYPNEADGGFGTGRETPAGFNPVKLTKGKFHSTGRISLIALSTGYDRVSLAAPQGDGGFVVTDFNFGIVQEAVFVGDVTADGKDDVVGYDTSSGVRVRPGLGNGNLGTVSSLTPFTPNLGEVVMVDVNADGAPDLVGINETLTQLSILPGVVDGGFGAALSAPLATGARAIVHGDVDADGRGDLVISHTDTSVSILLGRCP